VKIFTYSEEGGGNGIGEVRVINEIWEAHEQGGRINSSLETGRNGVNPVCRNKKKKKKIQLTLFSLS
jgi:hypothetical protein